MKQSTNSTFKSTKQTRNLRKYPRNFAKDKLTLKTALNLKSQFSGTDATSLSRNKKHCFPHAKISWIHILFYENINMNEIILLEFL